MATNPRPAGTRPAPSQKTRPAPPRLCNRVLGRVLFTQTGFYRVFNGSGFNEKPESDPKYLKKKTFPSTNPNLSVSLFSDLTRPAPPRRASLCVSESLRSYPTVKTSSIVHLIGRFLGALRLVRWSHFTDLQRSSAPLRSFTGRSGIFLHRPNFF
jgi:hypothetical protein